MGDKCLFQTNDRYKKKNFWLFKKINSFHGLLFRAVICSSSAAKTETKGQQWFNEFEEVSNNITILTLGMCTYTAKGTTLSVWS